MSIPAQITASAPIVEGERGVMARGELAPELRVSRKYRLFSTPPELVKTSGPPPGARQRAEREPGEPVSLHGMNDAPRVRAASVRGRERSLPASPA